MTVAAGAIPALRVAGLVVDYAGPDGAVRAVDGVSLAVGRGEIVAVIGESGSGKSTLGLAAIGLLPPGTARQGEVCIDGRTLSAAAEEEWAQVRGRRIGIVFQEPMSSLNPVLTVGEQVDEVFRAHGGLGRGQARAATLALLARCGIGDAAARAQAYPHQLSGGLRQRAAIAMAIAGRPAVLLADEATSALDVTVQAQILDLLVDLGRSEGLSILFITHDIAVAAEIADRIVVMYAGRVAEAGPAAEVRLSPRHPYTRALIAAALPFAERAGGPLPEIPGTPPAPGEASSACAFAPRCLSVRPECRQGVPAMRRAGGVEVACVLYPPGAA